MLEKDSDQILDALFRGVEHETLRCLQCECAREAVGAAPSFTTLQLPIVQECTAAPAAAPAAVPLTTFQSALDACFAEEKVELTEWTCVDGACLHNMGIVKKRIVSLAPAVLAVQLVRWNQHGKLLHHVHADAEVNAFGQRYTLRSVVCHCGASPHGGHYYAFAKYDHNGTDKWWLHNDAVRRLARPSEVKSYRAGWANGQVYLAFYEICAGAPGVSAHVSASSSDSFRDPAPVAHTGKLPSSVKSDSGVAQQQSSTPASASAPASAATGASLRPQSAAASVSTLTQAASGCRETTSDQLSEWGVAEVCGWFNHHGFDLFATRSALRL